MNPFPPSQVANPKPVLGATNASPTQNPKLPLPVFDDPKHGIRIYQGDSLELLPLLPENSVDLVFADPPYFLSNGGITCHAGRRVSLNKGAWDWAVHLLWAPRAPKATPKSFTKRGGP